MEEHLQVVMMSDVGYLALHDGVGMVKYKVDKNGNLVELRPTTFFNVLDKPNKILVLAQIIAYLEQKKTNQECNPR